MNPSHRRPPVRAEGPSPDVAGPRRGGIRSPVRLGALAWVCCLATVSCSKKEAAGPPPPPQVQVMEVQGTNLPLHVEIIGQLDSPENVEVRARVEAFVEQVLFVEGGDVKAGDPLFRLDERPYIQALANARGQLAQAKASLAKYERDVERLRPLAEVKAIPRQDLENAEASVEVGRAAVLSAEAMERSAALDLTYCDVRAQAGGRIGAKQVSVGDLVGKGEPTLLATISRLDPMWFYCAVSEVAYLRTERTVQQTGRKVEDLPVALILGDGVQFPEQGKFVFIDRAVDPKTGTLRVRAEFRNPNNLLRPGMFGRIRIDLGTRPDTIVLPPRAVSELQGRNFVWVVDAENKASQRAVRVADLPADGVVIQEGLKVGERIVVEGVQKVRQDAVVQPMTAEQMAEAAAVTKAGASAGPAKH